MSTLLEGPRNGREQQRMWGVREVEPDAQGRRRYQRPISSDRGMEIIDISVSIRPAMLCWPTGRQAAAQTVIDVGDGATPRNSEWTLDSHAGTHLDAPLHFLPAGADVEEIPLSSCIGSCTVAEVPGDGPIGSDLLPTESLRHGHRLLLKTANSSTGLGKDRFNEDFVALSLGAAESIADAGLALVGIDYLSIEPFRGNGAVHRTLLAAGVVLLESADLRHVKPGEYTLCALPLRLAGGEASPVRAVLWR